MRERMEREKHNRQLADRSVRGLGASASIDNLVASL